MSHPTNDQATLQPGHPHAAAQAGLMEWHRIVADLDWESLPALLTDDVRFRNPASFDAYVGKGPMVAILQTVFGVMEDFKYERHYGRADGYVMEFTARVGTENLVGIDMVAFDADGKITDFMVMIRPVSAVMSLAEEAGRRMATASTPASA
ncbi:nuclear transport factor 2 family protein [Acidovorax sp. LjRoot38]|uniref:nuclear transport factor 2 family protein n=1 Tax=Acidovorax sp. LjRoot38 TaxID=3342327 RepID=UPI003ED0132E